MKQDNKFTQWYIIAVLLALIVMNAIASKSRPHSCRWPLCPYKGIHPDQYRAKVFRETGNYLDGYRLGILHLQYPNDEYEQLEDRLPK